MRKSRYASSRDVYKRQAIKRAAVPDRVLQHRQDALPFEKRALPVGQFPAIWAIENTVLIEIIPVILSSLPVRYGLERILLRRRSTLTPLKGIAARLLPIHVFKNIGPADPKCIPDQLQNGRNRLFPIQGTVEAVSYTHLLDVLLELSDRILVLCNGRISGIVDARTARKEDIGLMMTGTVMEEVKPS